MYSPLTIHCVLTLPQLNNSLCPYYTTTLELEMSKHMEDPKSNKSKNTLPTHLCRSTMFVWVLMLLEFVHILIENKKTFMLKILMVTPKFWSTIFFTRVYVVVFVKYSHFCGHMKKEMAIVNRTLLQNRCYLQVIIGLFKVKERQCLR